MDEVLSVENLTKRFGTRYVIKNLCFSIKQGNRVTLFAPSGSGKTTLINILNNLDQDFDGSFLLTAQTRSTIFQEPRLFSYMTVEENIFFPLKIRQVDITKNILKKYEQWLDICELLQHSHHYPYQLSGGMKQKVALIRGFITNPDFMMMDEPFKSIDIQSKQKIIDHIVKAYPQTTILLVTHNLDEIPLLTNSLLLFKTNFLAEFRRFSNLSSQDISSVLSEILQELSYSN
jgi:ABC-type nitrate/sulfonate/bicarbonate transport system ATPase subunit